MRKLIILFLAAGLFIACNNDKKGSSRDDRRSERKADDYGADMDDDKNNKEEDKNSKEESKNTDNTSNSTWTEEDENAWMKSCKQEVQQMDEKTKDSYCGCILQKLKARFSGMDEVNRKGTEQMGLDMGNECLREMGLLKN